MNKIITREEWKAKSPRTPFIKHFPRKITVHHQGGTDAYPDIHQLNCFEGAKTMRAIQSFHQNGRGWSDISYHAVIAPNGDIYQGRPFDVVGAHVKNNNTGNIGIMIIGNFEVEKPTPEQIKSLKELIIYLKTIFIQLEIPKCIHGHKEFMMTDCPGKNLFPIILDIKYGKIQLFEEPK